MMMKQYTLIATLLTLTNTTTTNMASSTLRALAASARRAFSTMPATREVCISELKDKIARTSATQKEFRATYETEEKARRKTIVDLQRTIGELSRKPQNAQNKTELAVLQKRLAGIAQLHDKSALHFARVNRSYEETLTRFESQLSDRLA